MKETTRRDALKLATVGATVVAASAVASAQESKGQDQPRRGGNPGEAAGTSLASGNPYSEETREAKTDEVRPLFRGANGPRSEDLSGSGVTLRQDWGNRHGSWKLTLNWPAVRPTTLVFVSVGEGAAGGPNGGKFLGSAKFTLSNVAPRRAGGVDIWVDINWGSDIRLYVDYLAINP